MIGIAHGQRRWIVALVAVLSFHAILSLIAPDTGWTTSAGVGSACLLALTLCAARARTSDEDMRWRWRALASAFALWVAAYGAIAYLQSIALADPSRAHVDRLLYMLRGVPFLLILARSGDTDDGRPFRWADTAQALLFAGLAVLLLFPALARGQEPSLPFVSDHTALTYHDVQNFGLALLSIVGLVAQPSADRRHFGRAVCAMLIVYAISATLMNHFVIAALSPPPGSIGNLIGDLPAAVFILLTIAGPSTDRWAPFDRRRYVLLRLLLPGAFCGASIAAAFAIAGRNPLIGTIAALAAIALYAVRSALTQLRLVETRADLALARDRLETLADSDALTGLANRRCFDARLSAEWRRVARTPSQLAIILIDIDGFKLYNDGAGHRAGDQCLCDVAEAMRRRVRRDADLLARYGGEEFAVIAHVGGAAEAVLFAEAIREAVERAALPRPAGQAGIVTVSIGVALGRPGGTIAAPEQLIEEADVALYRAKAAGRNRVECAHARMPDTSSPA